MYTGNTLNGYQYQNLPAVYPCVYREHHYAIRIIESVRGLSLCIQGTPSVKVPLLIYMRFIPVYTGNTMINHLDINKMTVYPCVYREHFPTTKNKTSETGLSLCIQGTHWANTDSKYVTRFIPVYTGNT